MDTGGVSSPFSPLTASQAQGSVGVSELTLLISLLRVQSSQLWL